VFFGLLGPQSEALQKPPVGSFWGICWAREGPTEMVLGPVGCLADRRAQDDELDVF
jgi:hypothetical protein